MSNAAIYARVSSARQKEQETMISSQLAALRGHAEQLGLEIPEQWVFGDGHSDATLVRPALEKLRDLVA